MPFSKGDAITIKLGLEFSAAAIGRNAVAKLCFNTQQTVIFGNTV
jgi:hypothetical protein